MIMLGKNPGVFDSRVNTEAEVLDEYVVSRVLQAAILQVTTEHNNVTIGSHSSSSFFSLSSNESLKKSDFIATSQETTEDALEYIAGYLANKYKDSLPDLGQFTCKIRNDHPTNIPSWVQQLSYGGLIKPTDQWLKIIKTWNTYFEIHHGESIRKGPGVVKNLAFKISKREKGYPFNIIKDFCKLRSVIRMNYRNLKAKTVDKAVKRKSTDSDISRGKIRKLNKIIK